MTGLVLAACGSIQTQHTGPPHPLSHMVSDPTICAAFNRASSPLAHRSSAQDALAVLAARATDPEIRAQGARLLQQARGHPDAIAIGGKAFFTVGTICVAKGLTPKDWAELA